MLFRTKPELGSRSLIGIVAVIFLALAILSTQGGLFTGHGISHEDTIRIGVFAPLSGDGAIYGESMKRGLDMAMKEINEAGGLLGKRLELVYEDSHFDAQEAVTIMNKFINIDNLPIVISAEASGPTSAAAPMAESSRTLLMVSLASAPDIKDAGEYVFRVVPSDDYQGRGMARLAEKLGYRNAALLYVNDAYGIGIRDVFTRGFSAAGTIVSDHAFEPESTDFRSQLTKIKASEPDVIVIVARREFPLILKQAHEIGIGSQIIASESLKDESLVEASGVAAEGVLVLYYTKPTDYVGYREKFLSEYGTEPSVYSDFGYDSLMVLSVAIENASSTNSTLVKDELYGVIYAGATGVVRFDSNGEVEGKPFTIYRIESGGFVEYPVG